MTPTLLRLGERVTGGTRIHRTRGALGAPLIWLLSLMAAAGSPPAEADAEIFVTAGSGSVVVFPQTASGNVAPIRTLGAPGAGGVFVDSINHEIYVTDFGTHAIHVYARTATGTGVAPVRTIRGAATELDNPFGLFVDTVHDELIVAESGDDKVLIFPRTANGNVAPIRKIENHTLDDTGFFSPIGVFVDFVHDELFVAATKLHTDAILVFNRTTNGNTVVPIRQFATGFNSSPEGLFVNPATDEIIAAHTIIPGEIRVYPRTANAPITGNSPAPFPPTRSITGSATGLNKPAGLGVDLVNGEIIVSNLSSGDPNDPSPASVRVFPLSGSGNIAPLRVIKGPATGLSSIQLMALGTIPVLPASVVASVLPVSRSVKMGTTATAFATMINTGDVPLTNCEIAELSGPQTSQLGYVFQTTDPATNVLTGSPGAPVTIGPHGVQSFVFAFTPAFPFAPIEVKLAFQCAGSALAPVIVGLDTILLSASASAVPDLIALVATTGNNGIVDIVGSGLAAGAASAGGSGAFAVATANVGAGGLITVAPDTGSATLPLTLAICQTNPTTGACNSAIAASVTTQIDAGDTPTFAVFVLGQGPIPFDPANSRVFVRYKDQSGAVRGATSVAVGPP